MPLRPEEKRSVLSALLQYQQRFGEGAMAGMQETRQREFGLADEERQRKAQMEDARRKAALGLITQPLGREGEQIPLSEHLGIVAGDRPVTEDIMPYTPEREVDPFERERVSIARDREKRLREQFEHARDRENATGTGASKTQLFNAARALLGDMRRKMETGGVDESERIAYKLQAEDAFKEMLRLARDLDIDIGQYEVEIPDPIKERYGFLGLGKRTVQPDPIIRETDRGITPGTLTKPPQVSEEDWRRANEETKRALINHFRGQ